jgi:hypothetical protein
MKFGNSIFRAIPSLALAGTLFLTQAAHAVLLLPGTMNLPGAGDPIATIGPQFAPDLSYNVSFTDGTNVTGTGTLVVGVYTDNVSGLDFVYQYTLNNCCLGLGTLSQIAAGGFAGFNTDVGFDLPAALGVVNNPSGNYSTGGSAAINLTRSGGAGAVIDFNYGSLAAPAHTEVLVVNVANANGVTLTGSVSMTDDTGAGPFKAYAPTVPEPAYGGLLLGGLFGLGLLVARRFQTRQS